MDKEKIGLLSVEKILARSDFLKADIKRNDKTPSWDGEIFVYSKPGYKKSDLLGKVPIQIKYSSRETKRSTYFPVDVSDLKNYKKDGGAIFFLIKPVKKYNDEGIYYTSLLTVDLLKNLENVRDTQKTKNVHFRKFPDNTDEVNGIFTNFIYNRNLQKNTNNLNKLFTSEELFRCGYTKQFFTFNARNISEIPGQEAYLYHEDQLGSIICSSKVLSTGISFTKNYIQLTSGNNIFFKGAKVTKLPKDTTKLDFGDGCIVITQDQDKKCRMQVTFGGTFYNCLQTYQFVREASENKCFSIIDKQKTVLLVKNLDKLVEKTKSNLKILQNICHMFELLGVSTNIKLPGKGIMDLLSLISVPFLNKKPIRIESINKDWIVRIPIFENKWLLFIAIPMKEEIFLLQDYFHSDVSYITVGVEKNKTKIAEFKAPYFFTLNEADFYNALNFNLDLVHNRMLEFLNDIDKNNESSWSVQYALIHYWFKVVKAFDVTKRSEFLNKATEFLDILKNQKQASNFREAIFLNELQLIKRQREFTKTEMIELDNFVHSVKNKQLLAGAYLLKDDMVNFRIIFSQLDEATQEMFKSYPIYKFFKKEN